MGALYLDITSAFAGREGPVFVNYIYGLGGRDVPAEHIVQVFEGLKDAEPGELRYIGLRE
jgi:pyruvate/2-oxoacid:ferredoxin oxidoreductase alpha subunit